MTLSQRAELNTLRERYRIDLAPEGPEQDYAVEQIARSAWAIRILERQEAEIFRAYPSPYRNEVAKRSLKGVTALRDHYSKIYQASVRLFMRLANRDMRGRTRTASTQPEEQNS